MKLQKSLKIALNIIIHSKLRSWLTVIGIVIGVAAIVSIVSIGQGFQQDIAKMLGGLGSDIITVTPGFDRASQCPGPGCHQSVGMVGGISTKLLSEKEVQAIKSISNVAMVDKRISGTKKVYYLGETANLNIDGVDQKVWKYITTSETTKGRLLGPGDTNSIVIGSGIAEDLFKNEVGINRQITINGKSFVVVGILKKGGSFGLEDKKIYMPLDEAKNILERKDNSYDALIVKVKNADKVDQTEKEMENKIRIIRHVNDDTKDFTIMSMKALQEKVSAIMTGFTLFLGVIAAVSLIVGAVGIANTMFTSVLEKTKEIGVMKAIGARNKDIMMIFLFNSGLVGFVGGLIGVLVGVGISLLIPQLGIQFVEGGEKLTTALTPGLIIFALLFSVILGMISGVIPAYRASKLRPVDALRSE